MRIALLLFLFSVFSFSEPSDEQIYEVKKMIYKSIYYSNMYDAIKSLEEADKALKLAKKINNREALVLSYNAIAESTIALGLYKEALKYIEESEKICPPDHVELKSKILFLKGWCYAYLGFTEKALETHYGAINIITSAKNKKAIDRELLLATYQHIVVSYYDQGKTDSIIKYQEKSLEQISQLSHTDLNSNLFSTYYFNRGMDQLDAKDGDAALNTFNEIYAIKKKANASILHIENLGFGYYYQYKGDNKKALEYFMKAIADIEKYKIVHIELIEAYKIVSELHGVLGNPDKEKEYLQKYIQKKVDVTNRHAKNVEYAMNVILNDKLQEKSIGYTATIVIISVGSVVLISMLFLLYKKSQNKKSAILHQLKESEETVETLQQQVGASFDELVEMVKRNDNQFWPRFQEVHPKFLKKMMALNSGLSTAELTMSAQHYLGFTTKDIANYTFKSLRTVEGIRYRMRKKLGITPDENFILWIRKYLDDL